LRSFTNKVLPRERESSRKLGEVFLPEPPLRRLLPPDIGRAELTLEQTAVVSSAVPGVFVM